MWETLINNAKWPGGRLIDFAGRGAETRITATATSAEYVTIVGRSFTWSCRRADLEQGPAGDLYPAGSVALYGPLNMQCVIIPAAPPPAH